MYTVHPFFHFVHSAAVILQVHSKNGFMKHLLTHFKKSRFFATSIASLGDSWDAS